MILPHMLQTMTDEKAKKNRHTAIKALPTILELTDEIAYCMRLVEFRPLDASMARLGRRSKERQKAATAILDKITP